MRFMRRQGLLLACHFFVTFAAVASLSAADILWTNSAGGNWHVAANWNPNQVPAAGDTAFITNRGDYTVILNADASVASLFLGGSEGGQAITIGGSTLTMNGPARINSNSLVAVTGGTIGGSGDLRVEGVLNFFWWIPFGFSAGRRCAFRTVVDWRERQSWRAFGS